MKETLTQTVTARMDFEILSRNEEKQGHTSGDRNWPHDHWVQMPAEPNHWSQKWKGLRRQERLEGGSLSPKWLLLLKRGHGFYLPAYSGKSLC